MGIRRFPRLQLSTTVLLYCTPINSSLNILFVHNRPNTDPAMASKTYNVGVIGYGMSAKVFHIPLILRTPTFTLSAIVQRTPKPNDSAMCVEEDQLRAGMMPGDKGFGVESEERAGTLVVLEDGKPKASVLKNVEPETYAKLYEGFAKAVAGGGEKEVPVKASEARDVLRIIEAARESAKSGKSVSP